MASGAIVSGIFGADATRSAANKSADAIADAMAVQKQMHDEDIARQQPFYQQGINSLQDYAKMLEGGYDMKESPAAQYELQQGTKAANRQMAARGILGGGTAANRMAELGSGVAARDWQNQYARLLDSLKLGTGAAGQMGQSDQVFGSQQGQGANSLAGVFTNQGNTMAGLYQNIGNSIANTGATIAGAGIKNGWGRTPAPTGGK